MPYLVTLVTVFIVKYIFKLIYCLVLPNMATQSSHSAELVLKIIPSIPWVGQPCYPHLSSNLYETYLVQFYSFKPPNHIRMIKEVFSLFFLSFLFLRAQEERLQGKETFSGQFYHMSGATHTLLLKSNPKKKLLLSPAQLRKLVLTLLKKNY